MQAFDRGMEGEGASGFDIVAPWKDHHVRELSERRRERERETSVRPSLMPVALSAVLSARSTWRTILCPSAVP